MLGFRATVGLAEGLACTADWHRARRDALETAGLDVASVA
jgi:hypothetical protein